MYNLLHLLYTLHKVNTGCYAGGVPISFYFATCFLSDTLYNCRFCLTCVNTQNQNFAEGCISLAYVICDNLYHVRHQNCIQCMIKTLLCLK